jgi:hypothetical protein
MHLKTAESQSAGQHSDPWGACWCLLGMTFTLDHAVETRTDVTSATLGTMKRQSTRHHGRNQPACDMTCPDTLLLLWWDQVRAMLNTQMLA